MYCLRKDLEKLHDLWHSLGAGNALACDSLFFFEGKLFSFSVGWRRQQQLFGIAKGRRRSQRIPLLLPEKKGIPRKGRRKTKVAKREEEE